MREIFELSGKWWTPTNPDRTVTGIMTFDPSKEAMLELGIELFPETRFLLYLQALEAYHRFRYRNFEVDLEEHAKRLFVIISSIPEQYREWMRDGLEYSNEPSHGQRLKEIYHDLRFIMDDFVEDGKLFIFRVLKTRNHLTHSEEKGMVLEGKDLVQATARLRLMLELCLVREIREGVDQMKHAIAPYEQNRTFSTSHPGL